MSSGIVFLLLIVFGGTVVVVSYFVMRKVGNYANGSLSKSKIIDRAVDNLTPRVLETINSTKKLHGKIKEI